MEIASKTMEQQQAIIARAMQQLRVYLQTKTSRALFRLPESMLIMQMIQYSYAAEVAARRKAMQDDEATREHLKKFYVWITSQNTKPWLILNGNRGTGKSTLILTFADVVKQLYPRTYKSQGKGLRITNARDILGIATYQPDVFDILCDCELLAINDAGTEAPGKIWGTTASPLADILYSRYDKMLLTIFTTNMSAEDMGKFYGARLQDRFSEMCDYIGFNNKSYRSNE